MILHGWSLANRNTTWIIGSGSNIRILDNSWRGLGPPLASSPAVFNSLAYNRSSTVAELLVDGSWHAENTSLLFGGEEDAALAVHGCTLADVDTCRWSSSIHPLTVCKSLYLQGFESSDSFGWIWRSDLLPKIKVFTWRLCTLCLPTNQFLHSRGLAISPYCSWGCPSVDSPNHILSECIFTHCIHAAVRLHGFQSLCPPNLQTFLDNLRSTRKLNFHSQLALYVAHQAWFAKNMLVHKGQYTTPITCALHIINSLSTACIPPSPKHWYAIGPLRSSSPLWHPPPFGWIKFNFDGSFINSSTASGGAICRDNTGRIISVCGGPIIAHDALHAEYVAASLISSLVADWMVELQGIIIEGDCSAAISRLSRSYRALLRRLPQPDRNLNFLLRFKNVLFTSCSRADNRAADLCCKLGRQGCFHFDMDNIPPPFLSLAEEDFPP